MTIKDVKVRMSRIGIHKPGEPKKVMYMPLTTITYNETDEPYSLLLGGSFVKKRYYKGFVICKSFFVGITKDEYLIYDEKGEYLAAVLVETVGKVIQANEDYFVCLKDHTIHGIDSKGAIIASKELTDEELKSLTQ